ncbi:hypothetical protein H4582DRAFT_2062582 [Lactarius indigo]|nr:hypothetical protein H4582DRAFT_2062582 [Lactarius indigo]
MPPKPKPPPSPSLHNKLRGDSPPPPPTEPLPQNALKDIADIKKSLSALQKALASSTQTSKPPHTPKPTQAGPLAQKKPKATAPSFANVTALPPRPSVVISLAHLDWKDNRPSPAQLCTSINSALAAAQNDQVHISTVKWTARDNLVLMGGPNTMAHHLQLAIPTIHQHFSERIPASHDSHPIHIRPNVKWSKILINSVPTGVSPTTSAHSPDTCHAALVSENPNYATLTITQRPS